MNNYIIYTDGSYKSTKNSGGGSAIICDDNNIIKELFGGFTDTTNNRMEILGVLEGLLAIKEASNITIVSDSQYVVNTINNGGIGKMLQNSEEYCNMDLWQKVAEQLQYHNVNMKGVKGHATDELNNRADKLAQFAANILNLPKDEYSNNSKEGGKPLVPKLETGRPDGSNVGSENGVILYSLG